MHFHLHQLLYCQILVVERLQRECNWVMSTHTDMSIGTIFHIRAASTTSTSDTVKLVSPTTSGLISSTIDVSQNVKFSQLYNL